MKESLINKFPYYLKRTSLSVHTFLFALLLFSLLSIASFAQYSKVMDFESTASGAGPEGSLLYDGTFLYGTTRFGGTNNLGTIFKIKPDGTGYARLLDFEGTTNGRGPLSSLIYDGTFLYGMTSLGGSNDRGTVFKIKTDGTAYSKLLDFDNPTTGSYTESTLFYDGAFLYGMASLDGSNGMGTLFKLKTDGTGYVTLLNFAGVVNGSAPHSSLISDGTSLYGTTRRGGMNDLGTIFKIKPDGTGYINLLNFSGTANGGEPYGDLFYDGTFLYGTTLSGGLNNNGTLFKIKPDGTGYNKLHDFSGTATGDSPTGSLISDGTFLYGMTASGGTSGFGTIFKIKTDGTAFSKLTDFNGTDGLLPLGSLISDGVFLYGMTSEGGANSVGTLFKYAFASPIPTITNFTPANGSIGTTVIITGTNFSATRSNNIVFFGATQATVSAASSSQLTVTVPAGATYESISVLVNGLTAYSSKPFIVTFPDGGVINSCSFAAKVDITTGTEPYSIAIGDLDGDGKSDLAVANQISNTISVFRNISSLGSLTTGSFAPKVDFATNDGPYYVGIRDLDGDGKPELFATNNDSDNVSIYKNVSTNGVINSASFAAKVDFATGENPWNTTVDDFDLDGRPDLAIVNDVGNTVSILRNISSKGIINATSFATHVEFATGSFPIGIDSEDLDGDGKIDIVVTNQAGTSISVLRNTSTVGSITASSFAAKVDFPTGLDPYSVAIGDLNANGKPEIAVANYSSGAVSVFNNTSTPGSITFSGKEDFDSGTRALMVSLNDIDGDGRVDLTVTNGGNRISVLKNINSSAPITASSFSPRVDFMATNNPYGLAIGDLDGNGKPDVAAVNFSGATASLLRNTVSSLPPFTASSFSPASGPIGTVVIITGTNFSTTPINNTVKFNGVVATVTASSSTSITTTVPAGATTGPISLEIGCSTAITITSFTITAGSILSFTTQPSDRIMCPGSIATFTTEATGATAIVYQWQKFDGSAFLNLNNGGGYSGVNTSILSINTLGNFGDGVYRCRVSGDNATSVFSQSVVLSFTPNSTIAEITINGTTLTASSGDAYQWYQNDEAVVGATDQSFDFTALEYGTYKVDVTNNGCTSTSPEFEYLITGLEHLGDGIKMYPNPVEQNLFVEFKPPYQIEVIGVSGNIVRSLNIETPSSALDFSSLSKGIYFLKIKNEIQTQYLRIIKK